MSPQFETFGWGELFSMIAVIISFVTICVSLYGKSKNDTRKEQELLDKLDTLNDTSKETRDDVKKLSNEIMDYGNRLIKVESDIDALFRRVSRIEKVLDSRYPGLPSIGETTI